jgi:hypothetical protein
MSEKARRSFLGGPRAAGVCLLVLALGAAACAPAAAPAFATDPPSTGPTAVVPAHDPATPLPPAGLSSPDPTETIAVGPGGQYATDPSTVSLAAGRPTLVKFFAFW